MKRKRTILRLPRTVPIRENMLTLLKSCQIRQPKPTQLMDLLTLVLASESHDWKVNLWMTR